MVRAATANGVAPLPCEIYEYT